MNFIKYENIDQFFAVTKQTISIVESVSSTARDESMLNPQNRCNR